MSTPLCFIFTNAAVNGFFANPSRRFWWLFLKGYVSGSLAAPSVSSPVLNTLTFSAAVLFRGSLTFFIPPLPRGSLLTHLRKLALPPGRLGPCPLCPLLLPLARVPWGASAVRTRYGRLSTAPRHLQVSAALCSGASRRQPTSVAASGSSLPAAFARRAPTAGVPGGATARPSQGCSPSAYAICDAAKRHNAAPDSRAR